MPLSWYFIQITLSLSSYLTVSVLNIPYSVLEGKTDFSDISGKEICSVYVLDMSGQITNPVQTNETTRCATEYLPDGKKTITMGELLKGEGLK